MRHVLTATVILGLTLAFWLHERNGTIGEASEYQPTGSHTVVIPAGTKIQVALPYGIPRAVEAGDKIVAFVAAPVLVNDSVAIADGAPIHGLVEHIRNTDKEASAQLEFSELVIDGRGIMMQAEPVIATLVPDFEILQDGLEVITGGALGAALGAATQNENAVSWGLAEGGLEGASQTRNGSHFQLVLKRPLSIPK
jgi:hypothetical protein